MDNTLRDFFLEINAFNIWKKYELYVIAKQLIALKSKHACIFHGGMGYSFVKPPLTNSYIANNAIPVFDLSHDRTENLTFALLDL